MKLTQYQVDAFAAQVFGGNPAAICPLETWLDDSILQAIAEENNLSETAFFVREDNAFHLRWFTPVTEVDLCGHATLASAHVIFTYLGYTDGEIVFQTRSGQLLVTRRNGLLEMDFPSVPPHVCAAPQALIEGLGQRPNEVWAGDDYIAVYDSEAAIRALAPDLARLAELDLRGVIATAPGDRVDFVSRFFAPKYGIPEDPVTGSAHCALTPLWADKLDKIRLHAWQISRRGGDLHCRLDGDRVTIAGQAATFMEGEIMIPDGTDWSSMGAFPE